MRCRVRFTIQYMLAEFLLLGIALGSFRMLLVDAPLTQSRVVLVFPLFICFCMCLGGLAKEWTGGALLGLFLSILAATGLLLTGGT